MKLQLKKLPELDFQTEGIKVSTFSGDEIGLILCDGAFIPGPDVELYAAELRSILTIQENFSMFYDNIN